MASYDENQRKPITFRGPQSFVTIKAGNGVNGPVESFTIQKAVLCYYSPVLRAAFTGEFSEAETGILIWDDVESEIVGIMVDWLYTKKVQNKDGGEVTAVNLLKLWTLAERYLIPGLQNAALAHHLALFMQNPDLIDEQQESYDIVALKTCIDYVQDQDGGVSENLKTFVTDSVIRVLTMFISRRTTTETVKVFLDKVVPMLYEGSAVNFIVHLLLGQFMVGITPVKTLFDIKMLKTWYFVKEG